jgi:hypothetical protein
LSVRRTDCSSAINSLRFISQTRSMTSRVEGSKHEKHYLLIRAPNHLCLSTYYNINKHGNMVWAVFITLQVHMTSTKHVFIT